ncbi:MAG: universal stress protein [Pseudomonadota bacterium]
MGKLLAFVDGSIYADSVADHAVWIAGRAGLDVDLVHVLGRREMSGTTNNLSGNITLGARSALLAELSELDEQRAKLAQARGRLLLDGAAARVREGGVAEPGTRLRIGELLDSVGEADAEMILIGKRGEGADFAKLHLGSNLERVVRASPKPVFVAAREFRDIKRVLIAFDGGTSSLKAVDHVSRSTLYAGLEIHVLSAGPDTSAMQQKLDTARGMLAAAGFEPKLSIRDGQPDHVIARAVEEDGIDLLVMGAYGHSRIRTLIIGSTTTEMIRSCKIPVVLYR